MALVVRTTAGASTPGFVQPGSTRRAGQIGGGHAAGACRSVVWVNSGYQRWKSSASWLLRTRVRTCSSRWAPRGDQRICCFLSIRLLMTWLTADSTNELSITPGPDGPPTKSGLSLVDFSSGIAAALALVAGVHSARRDQKGMDCDLALHDVALSMLNYLGTWHLTGGYERNAHHNPRTRLTSTGTAYRDPVSRSATPSCC